MSEESFPSVAGTVFPTKLFYCIEEVLSQRVVQDDNRNSYWEDVKKALHIYSDEESRNLSYRKLEMKRKEDGWFETERRMAGVENGEIVCYIEFHKNTGDNRKRSRYSSIDTEVGIHKI